MEVIRNVENEDKDLRTVEVVKDEKHLKMSLNKYDELEVSFSYGENEKGNWFQETFEVDKNDGEFYNAVDGTFASYSGDVFFDTHGANLVLYNDEGNYRFFFMEDDSFASKEIKCRFFDHSIENDSMKYLFNRVYGRKEQKFEKPRCLSKTLKKLVDNSANM